MRINDVAQTKHCACGDTQFTVSTQSLSFVLCHEICDLPAVSSVQPTQQCYAKNDRGQLRRDVNWQQVLKQNGVKQTGTHITGATCRVHIFQVIQHSVNCKCSTYCYIL
jgi:hypothetical protein